MNLKTQQVHLARQIYCDLLARFSSRATSEFEECACCCDYANTSMNDAERKGTNPGAIKSTTTTGHNATDSITFRLLNFGICFISQKPEK
jgi:hypothetical protein